MKKITQVSALILAAAMLAACGGGGSDGSPSGGAAVAPVGGSAGAVTPPLAADLITVAAMPAPTYTAADCPRFTSEATAIAALDLSNATIKKVNDFVFAVDPDHAYKVFVRRPYDFVNWMANLGGTMNLTTLGLATHETAHMVNFVLRACAPGYKALFFGNILDTGLLAGETTSPNIVAAVIDPALKSEPRFDIYVTQAASGNDFRSLLDEFSAYTGSAHTEFKALSLGKIGDSAGSLDGDLGGTVNLMVYLEVYLQAARMHNPASYDKIRNSAAIKAVIQTVWTAAEQALRDSYPFVKSGSISISNAYLAAAYSDTLAAELDLLGIAHATAAAWRGTYMP